MKCCAVLSAIRGKKKEKAVSFDDRNCVFFVMVSAGAFHVVIKPEQKCSGF